MSELYQRRNQVFGETMAGGPVLDMRVRWTSDLVCSPLTGLTPGETRFIAGAWDGISYTLELAARHPLLADIYYRLEISGNLGELVPYQVTAGDYTVKSAIDHVTMLQYLVRTTGSSGQTVALSVVNKNLTIMLDLENTAWPDGTTVEPFNVVFDYLPQSVSTVIPHISGGSVNIPISGNIFTNTPLVQQLTSGGAITVKRPEIAHSFELVGSSLSINGMPAIPVATGKIESINGITADHGGITIKFLQ